MAWEGPYLTLQDGLELQSDSWESLAAPEKGMLSAEGELSSPRHKPADQDMAEVKAWHRGKTKAA